MRALLPAFAVLLIPASAVAGPLKDPAPWVLPVNVFAKAKPGDWTILEGDALLDGKMLHEREIIRVGPVKKGVAEVQMFEGKAGMEGWFLSFPVDVRRGPDSNLFYDVPWIATDLTQAPATCTLGDATFDCTEVRYHTPTLEITARMSTRVLGSGIVSFAIVRKGKPYWTMTAIGYGTAGKTAWGEGPPRADLEVWDGGAQPTRMRAGTDPATGDVYETPEQAMRALAPHADVTACTVDGGREAPVRQMVERKLQAMEDCYSDALAGNARLGGGTIEVSFRLDAGAPGDVAAKGTPAAAGACASDAIQQMELGEDEDAQVSCTIAFDPGRHGKPGARPTRRLITKAHPARGGPDLRGLQRIP
ncbi:MAG TPA: hypothetical protein VHE35_11810 [Kofleriaceae bacterium]|nr:hypothetical protein [Kofleriaceae bacterium]